MGIAQLPEEIIEGLARQRVARETTKGIAAIREDFWKAIEGIVKRPPAREAALEASESDIKGHEERLAHILAQAAEPRGE